MEKDNRGGGAVNRQTSKKQTKNRGKIMVLFTRGSPVEKLLNPIA